MTEALNCQADLGTLARHALLRDLIADGVPEDEALSLVDRLEIRVRDYRRRFGIFNPRHGF